MLTSLFRFNFAAPLRACTGGRISRHGLPYSSLLLLAAALLLGSNATGQTATTTSLTLTSGGQTASTIATGAKITLTASVKAGGTTITRGLVNFCDASATYCTDIHVLGSAQITSAGTATLNLRPAPGSYRYKAEFVGTPHTTIPYGPSSSSTATLTVTGTFSTATTFVAVGPPGDYSLYASMYGFAKSTTALATGTASFVDSTTGNSILSTASMPNQLSGPGPIWLDLTNSSYAGTGANSIVTADFNGDGNLDLAVAATSYDSETGAVTILLGDGTGNFTPLTGSSIATTGSQTIEAVADFNGDGIPDLLLSPGNNELTVLLGKGDGTFTAATGSPFSTALAISPIVVADFNGDGIPDLAIGGGAYLTVMLGNGDGTFTALPTSSSVSTPAPIQSIVVGDFNGDGVPDLATTDNLNQNVSIYLGNGDGTFQQPLLTNVSTTGGGTNLIFAAADFNGDGKLDLAIPVYSDPAGVNSVAILLGNGNGTFEPATGSPISSYPGTLSASVGDFNGDGVADLMIMSQVQPNDTSVELGNGDGTFSPVPLDTSPYLPLCSGFVGNSDVCFVLGDFNGDQVTDIAAFSYSLAEIRADIYLTAGTYSAAAVNGIAVTGTTTPQQVVASYSGDSNYAASTSAPFPLLVQAAAPVFNPPSGIIISGQSITITSSTPGAQIDYGATGVLQATSPTLYTTPLTFSGTGNLSIQAYTTAPNYGQSAIATANYTVVASYPVPAITSLTPAIATAGGAAFTLTITGSDFVSGSTAYWGSTALTTQYVGATQLTAQVTAAQIAAAGTGVITVQSPAPGGGTSNTFQFEIDSAGSATPPSIATSTVSVSPGSTATYSVTLPSSATGVTVNCLNLPTGASCSYSSGTLTITTTSSTPAGTYQVTAVFTETLPGAASAIVFAPLLLLPLAGLRKKFKKESLWLIAFLAVAVCATVSGCGGGNSGSSGGGGGTPAQTHQVTSSATVTLTVQ